MNLIDVATYATFIISLVITVTLVVIVYKHNPKSASNRIFVLLGITIFVWLIILHFSFLKDVFLPTIYWIRASLYLGGLQCALVFIFSHTIPSEKIQMNNKVMISLLLFTAAVMILALTPYLFSEVTSYINGFPNPKPEWGLAIFNVFAAVTLLGSIAIIAKKYKKSESIIKSQYRFVLIGILGMYGLVLLTISLPIIFFQNNSFVKFHYLYTLILIVTFAFAITRHRLFNIRVAIQGWLIKSIIIVAVSALGLAVVYAASYVMTHVTSEFTNQTAVLYSLIFGVIITCASLIHYILSHYFTRSSYDLSVPAELALVEDANVTLQQLRRTVSKVLQDQYDYETILFFMYDWREKRYRTYQDNKIKTMPENHSIITMMNSGPMILTRDSIISNQAIAVATRTEILSYMRRHQADSIIPLYTELFTPGIVVVKQSDSNFAVSVPERELLEFGKLYGHYMERILTFDALISKQPEA